jgi:hypothetical protein
MANPARKGRKTLTLKRLSERSRLQEQIFAAAYELVSPIIRRSLKRPTSDQRTPSATSADKPRRSRA